MSTHPNDPPLRDPADFGFPEAVVAAFLDTADAVGSVVMTRAPGQMATELIDDRYDLKGFRIKAKSCDWGPMAGFVCSDPYLSKKGAAGADANEQYHLDYLDVLRRMLAAGPIDQWDRAPMASDGEAARARAFVPLKISLARLADLRGRGVLGSYDNELRIGLAANGDERKASTIAEYLIGPEEGGLCSVYLRNVYKRNAHGEFVDAERDPFRPTAMAPYTPANAGEIEAGFALLRARAPWTMRGAPPYPYLPACGACNPYRPYAPNGPDGCKNAVSGDYDLFALWPVLTSTPLREFARVTELNAGAAGPDVAPAPPWRFFLPVNEKPFTVQSAVSRNVFVEFVPFFPEASRLEDESLGNINDAVHSAAQTLNAFVALRYGSHEKPPSPNVAFHSDEGGRPGIDDIDLPIGVFYPEALARRLLKPPPKTAPTKEQLQARRVRILDADEHPQFLELVHELKDHCYVFLHYRWVAKLSALIESYRNDDAAVQQAVRDGLRRGLGDLFLGVHAHDDAALAKLEGFFRALPEPDPPASPEPPKALTLVHGALALERG